jgi:serine/threonine protein kinase
MTQHRDCITHALPQHTLDSHSFGDDAYTLNHLPQNLLATEFEGQIRVGSGSFFDVFRATHHHSGIVYALKRSKREFISKRERAEYLREVQTVSQLDLHPNIIT